MLREHAVGNRTVVPGVGYVELALAAALKRAARVVSAFGEVSFV